MDFENFVASIVREKFQQFDEESADAREQQGIAQVGLGTRPMSDRPGLAKEDDEIEVEKLSTATRVLTDMSDYYQPDEFPTQEVRVDSAPRFSSINKSTVLDILSANRDGLEKQGIIKMPMGMLRKADPTLDIDSLQSRILDKLDLRPPEGSPQDIQYGAEIGKLGRFRDDYTSIDVDRDAPAGGGQDNQPNVADAEPNIRVGVKTGLGARTEAKVENIEDMPPLGAGDLIRMSSQFRLTDDDDNFSQSELSNAMSSIQDNPWYSALVLGTNTFETGGDGLVDEELYYSPPNARKKFGTNDANRVLATLPQDVQTRLNDGSHTSDDRNIYGIALADDQYDGGSTYAGRGLIQLTGRENYQTVQTHLAKKGIDIDLVGNPELANDPRYALPIALSFFDSLDSKFKLINEQNAKEIGPYKLSLMVNSGEGEAGRNLRWNAFTANLTGTDLMDARLSDEKAAQRTAGLTGDNVDGIIGDDSKAAMREYLIREGATIPENATGYDLVRLVNGAGVQG